MDLGATLCVRARPDCSACPIASDCVALREGAVAELPAPRPRRAVPLRRCTMFVIRRGRQVLVERRPPSGIWGGLWSLPESASAQVGAAQLAVDGGPEGAPDPAALAGEIERRFGLRVTPPRALAPFDHAFTHFRLHVQPVECELLTASRAADAPGLAWLALDEAVEAALPRPVKTLLQGLALRSPGAAAGTGGSATGG
jgi:A/G-specific adenine glycosylase